MRHARGLYAKASSRCSAGPGRFARVNDFKPGLEGVVAFETEIAEPDREGGALRYRGRRHRGARRRVRTSRSGACSSTTASSRGCRDAGDVELGGPHRRTRRPTSRRRPRDLSADWGLGKLIDISDEQARDDLARLSAEMISHRRAVGAPSPTAAAGAATTSSSRARPPPSVSCSRWRGEADPRHVQAIDTYWVCAAEHGLNASTFTARIVASTGRGLRRGDVGRGRRALAGRCTAARRRASSRCSTRPRRAGDADGYVREPARHAASASWASATASTAPRIRARASSGALRGSSARRASRSPRSSSGRPSRSCRARNPSACSRRTSSSGRPSCSTSPRSRPTCSPRCSPAPAPPAGRRTSSSRSAPAG